MEEVYGGLSLDRDGLPAPSIMGRLCQWKPRRAPATYATYEDFKADLKVECQETGSPGVLRFKADYDMPSLMYYQVRISVPPFLLKPCMFRASLKNYLVGRFICLTSAMKL